MPLNKAEKVYVEHLQNQAALRWPTFEEPKPTVEPDGYGDNAARGWLFNAHTREISEAWSGPTSHGYFYDGKASGGTQGGRRLYATQADALKALRWAACRDIAGKLRLIDDAIAEAQGQ